MHSEWASVSAKSSVNRHRHHSFQLKHFIRSKKSRNMRTTAMAATAKPYNFPLTVQKGKHTITTVVAMTRWNISCIHRILCTHGTTFHCKRFFFRKKIPVIYFVSFSFSIVFMNFMQRRNFNETRKWMKTTTKCMQCIQVKRLKERSSSCRNVCANMLKNEVVWNRITFALNTLLVLEPRAHKSLQLMAGNST